MTQHSHMTQEVASALLDIDERAHVRLVEEIEQARSKGHVVTIGRTVDVAYDHPERIHHMYDNLKSLDAQLANRRRELVTLGVGPLGLSPLRRRQRTEQALYLQLEPMRDDLLFGPDASDSRAWHNQRGKAAALLTIVYAHELKAPDSSDGRYGTMAGPLDERVLDYTFDERAPNLDGMSVRDALVWSDMTYKKKHQHIAELDAEQRVSALNEFLHAPNSPKFKEIVEYCTDSLGIRARKEEVHEKIRNHLLSKGGKGKRDEYIMMSFGCGTALPMLEVIADLRTNHGIRAKLLLLDQDPLALASAACLADTLGVADEIELHCEQLFSRIGTPLKLDTILRGRQLDIAEDSGLREYLPDAIYRKLTRESWKNLRDGGLMTTGNMNVNRPQSEFLHGMMGWVPRVRMRAIEEGLRLHRAAGIPAGLTSARVTRDGVYTLYFTEK